MNVFWRLFAEPSLRASFGEVRYGYQCAPVGLRTVITEDLRFRREPLLIPRSPVDLPRIYLGAPTWKAENPIERYFPLEDGVRDRRFVHSPHVRLIREYQRTGSVSPENDYADLLMERARLQGRPRTQDFIRAKMDAFIRLYESIKRLGYMNWRFARYPIAVFEHPIHPPVAGYRPTNWEVADGHHRAAVVVCLGLEKVAVLVLRPKQVERYDWSCDIPISRQHD